MKRLKATRNQNKKVVLLTIYSSVEFKASIKSW